MLGPVIAGTPQDFTRKPWVKIFFVGTGTISGGAFTIEEAPTVDYAGTWSPIGAAFTASTVSGGKTLSVSLPVAAYAFVRVRESTPVSGGGTVDIYAVGIDAQ